MIYEELLNVRALRHLTNAVKIEVAACVRLQHHPRPGQYRTSCHQLSESVSLSLPLCSVPSGREGRLLVRGAEGISQRHHKGRRRSLLIYTLTLSSPGEGGGVHSP